MDPCYFEHQKYISNLLGNMKMRMSAISSLKNRFTAIWSTKKMDPRYLEVKKTLVNSYFEPEKLFRSNLESEKKWIPAIWSPQMSFTIFSSKEKEDDSYFKSEKLIHRYLEQEKHGSQLFGSRKNWFTTISSQKTVLQLFGEIKKCIPAIKCPKNLLHNSLIK